MLKRGSKPSGRSSSFRHYRSSTARGHRSPSCLKQWVLARRKRAQMYRSLQDQTVNTHIANRIETPALCPLPEVFVNVLSRARALLSEVELGLSPAMHRAVERCR